MMQRAAEENGAYPLFELEKGNSPRTSSSSCSARKIARPSSATGSSSTASATSTSRPSTPNEPMVEPLMRDLKRRGYRMALPTNNVREWEPLWRLRRLSTTSSS